MPDLTHFKTDIFIERKAVSWSSEKILWMTMVCWVVGLNSVWRFPTIVIEKSGLTYLVPYLFFTITLSIPVCFAELAIGQFSSCNMLSMWKMCPLWRGVGWAAILNAVLQIIYLNITCCYMLQYIRDIFRSEPVWINCDPSWASINCYTFANNISDRLKCQELYGEAYCNSLHWQSSAEHYYYKKILEISNDNSFVSIRWNKVIYSTLNNILIYVTLRKGIFSVEKYVSVLCILPHLLQVILLFVALLYPGSFEALINWIGEIKAQDILRTEIWSLASHQCLLNMGPGFGGLVLIGQYSNFRNPVHAYAIYFSFIGICCTLMFICIAYAATGTVTHALKLSKKTGNFWESNLIFVKIPIAIKYWGSLYRVWSFIYFLSLHLICFRTQMCMTLVLFNVLQNYIKITPKHIQLSCAFFCFLIFLAGFLYMTKASEEIMKSIDEVNSSSMALGVLFLEVFGIMWIYGVGNFIDDVHFMLGFQPSTFFKVMWGISPILVLSIYIGFLKKWFLTPTKTPWLWLEILQQVLIFLPFIIHIIAIVCQIARVKHKNWVKLIKPRDTWGPKNPILKKSRDMFSAHSMTKEYMYRQNRLRSRKFKPVIITPEMFAANEELD